MGAGQFGNALANYNGLDKSNFTVVALFDNDETKIGERTGGGIAIFDVNKIAKVVREQDNRCRCDRGARARRAKSTQSGDDRRRESNSEFCARAIESAFGRESENRGSHNLAGIAFVFSGATAKAAAHEILRNKNAKEIDNIQIEGPHA